MKRLFLIATALVTVAGFAASSNQATKSQSKAKSAATKATSPVTSSDSSAASEGSATNAPAPTAGTTSAAPSATESVPTSAAPSAAPTDASISSSSESVVSVPSESGIILSLDVRPSTTVGNSINKDKNREYHTENTVTAGYKFSKDLNMGWYQEFNTNMSNGASGINAATSNGLGLTASNGSLRTKVNNIYQSGNFSFSYENRLYLPTPSNLRDAGMIASMRNYLMATQKFNPIFSIMVAEVPIFHAFNRTGDANPIYQNRGVVMPSISLGSLSIDLPIILDDTRLRNGSIAAAKGNWTHMLWVYPEIDYALTANLTLGAAYYSGNLIKPDFSGFDLSNGFNNGVVQAVVRASL